MKIAEILNEQELAELLDLFKTQGHLKQQRRRFIVQPNAVKSAQMVNRLTTNIAVSQAKRKPSEIEVVQAMWKARDLQKQADANLTKRGAVESVSRTNML